MMQNCEDQAVCESEGDGRAGWSDEEEDEGSAGWQAVFEGYVRTDRERLQRKEQKKQAKMQRKELKQRVRSESADSFASTISPSDAPTRFGVPKSDISFLIYVISLLEDAVPSETLGKIAYKLKGEFHSGVLATDGGVIYNGAHYPNVSAWISQGLGKRLCFLPICG
mmetsp:Transcript_26418/g.69408  ORF Transcript_26418/g.69408 Transcript_26418/m.69408 type:complete len:167 (+) Transcript_26418:72-572(+)